jgi:hypothetical protein
MNDGGDSIILISRIFGFLMLICVTLFIMKMLNENFKKGYKQGYKDGKNNNPNEYELD